MKDLEKRIEKIEIRNKKVEIDKAWETSGVRKVCIALLTYLVVLCYTYIIKKVDSIFLSSLIPVIGFLLSTLTVFLFVNCGKKGNKDVNLLFYVIKLIKKVVFV